MKSTLYQVSTMDALMQGWLYGIKSVSDIRELGDTGIGTFDGAEGELIALDGKFYKAAQECKVVLAKDDETLPFCSVAKFDTEWTSDITLTTTLGSMEKAFSNVLDNFNHFYMARLDGYFQSVTIRTLKKRTPPYTRLAATTDSQYVVTVENLRGSIISLYCPPYVKGLSLPGWHSHFICAERKIGGHVLEVSLASGKAAFTRLTGFDIELANDPRFGLMDLTRDMSLDTHKVER